MVLVVVMVVENRFHFVRIYDYLNTVIFAKL